MTSSVPSAAAIIKSFYRMSALGCAEGVAARDALGIRWFAPGSAAVHSLMMARTSLSGTPGLAPRKPRVPSIRHDREARPVQDGLHPIHQLGSHGAEALLPKHLRGLVVKALHLPHAMTMKCRDLVSRWSAVHEPAQGPNAPRRRKWRKPFDASPTL